MVRESVDAIEVRSLSKRFQLGRGNLGDLPVLNRVSFSVSKGEFVGIIGPNGCGKSTLLRIILGLLPSDGGDVTVLGETPQKARIGYVPQHATGSLFPWFTSLENVAFAHTSNDSTRFELAKTKLNEFGLSQYADAYPYQLSGGTKQLVSLARATSHSCVFLLDEPLNGLDYQNRFALEKRILKMRNGENTVLLVSHDIESTVLLCDKILILSSKPARIKALLSVSLGENRSSKTRFEPEYARILNQVYSLISE